MAAITTPLGGLHLSKDCHQRPDRVHLGTSEGPGNVNEFLLGELAEGPRPSSEILDAGLEQGFSRRTLQRAKKRLGITAEKTAFSGHWQWNLPKGALNDSELEVAEAVVLEVFPDAEVVE